MRRSSHHDYHQFHPPRYRRGRPQLLDRVVISCAVLLAAAALYLGVRRLMRGSAPPPPAVVLPAAPGPMDAVPPPLEAAPRAEKPLDFVPAIELARTGKPTRRKVVVPAPQ
ncbi:MAG: hypothetical protein WC943_08340 [Elusimicrobiota bacterium]|jgi:hypothetical protein